MENFPTDIMLFFALILMLFLETGRMFLFRRFRLHLPRQSPWQETYYVRYAFFCFALTPFLTALVSVLSIAWAAISKTRNIYLGGISLVLLTGLVGGLLFVALHRIMPLDKKLVALVIIGTVLDMACFIYKGTRLLFGGTLMVLLTSAVGRPLRFTDWTSLLDWLRQDRAGEEARVTFLVQAQAAVRRDSDGNVSIRTLGVPLPSSPTELLRTNLARQQADGRHDDVVHQRSDDPPKRCADDDADGQIKHAAPSDKRLKLGKELLHLRFSFFR